MEVFSNTDEEVCLSAMGSVPKGPSENCSVGCSCGHLGHWWSVGGVMVLLARHKPQGRELPQGVGLSGSVKGWLGADTKGSSGSRGLSTAGVSVSPKTLVRVSLSCSPEGKAAIRILGRER